MTTDPFVHHPALRDRIVDPLSSFYRSMNIADIDARLTSLGLPIDWHYTQEEMVAAHKTFLDALPDGDLWVFAYGSLMWDPAFVFAELRRGRMEGFSRRFILKDVHGGRGNPDAPGLMAALDDGDGCEGFVFRIDRAHVPEESWILWKREMIAPAYKPVFGIVSTALGPVTAMTFGADHTSPVIAANLTHDEQVHLIATGVGFLGTSLAYLENIASQFDVLKIADDEVDLLLADVHAYAATQPKPVELPHLFAARE